MAADLNHVVLVGRLTADPEVREVGEQKVVRARLAVTSRGKKDGDWADVANFFDVIVWNRQGEALAKYSGKGKRVGITGRLSWREWTDKEGNKRQSVEVVASEVQFLQPNESSDKPAQETKVSHGITAEDLKTEFNAEQIQADEELPF